MKKIIIILLSLLSLTLFLGAKEVSAEEGIYTTSDWMPQRYIISGYDIPTTMTYTENSVSFHGSLNAGIATTGFNLLKPIDINDFEINLDLNIPNIDKLTWLSFTFLDTSLVKDSENDTAPVAMPFNAMTGKGGYRNTEQTGLVLQFWTESLLTDNVFGLSYVSKNLDLATGEKVRDGWKDYSNTSIVNGIKLDNEYDGKLALSIKSTEEGLNFNVNDGAWKYADEEGEYTLTRESMVFDNTAGLKEYFSTHECYFACVMMYKDEIHREVELKVTEINGQNPSDNKAPLYLGAKTLEKDNIKVTIPANAIGIFGVYPSSVDGIKVIKYDEDDGDYEVVQKRAQTLNGTVIDYFRVVPQIGTKNVLLENPMSVEYTLPSGYDQYKAYFINDDDETQAIASSYVTVSDSKMTIKVDNEMITKIVIYGINNEEPTSPSDGGNNSSNNSSSSKKGCKSSLGLSILSVITLGSASIVFIKKRRDE